MISDGILSEGEPIELLDGELVRKDRSAAGEDPMTVSTQHSTAVGRIDDLNSKFKRLGCHIRVQQPLTLAPYNEPEPDAAIVVGKIADYSRQHPHAKDVLCVIEVADSSLLQDRTKKSKIYANSGIAVYCIINLEDEDKAVEMYARPLTGKGRYGHIDMLSSKQSVTFPAPGGKKLTVPVRRLLP